MIYAVVVQENPTETGLYYLQSRYYDPGTGRFINADSLVGGTGSVGVKNNMFAYTNNNPVMMTDPDGHLPFLAITAAIGAAMGAVAGGVIGYKKTGNWKGALAGAGIGAVAGGLIGTGVGAAAGIALAGSITATTGAVMTGGGALAATISGGGLGAGGAMIADNVSQAVSKTPQILWSGGEVAKNVSQKAAQNIGGKTLEMTRLGQYLEKTEAPMKMWEAASQNFANTASGNVNAFICNSSYRDVASVFWRIEMPTLAGNSKVSEVVIHIFE